MSSREWVHVTSESTKPRHHFTPTRTAKTMFCSLLFFYNLKSRKLIMLQTILIDLLRKSSGSTPLTKVFDLLGTQERFVSFIVGEELF